MTSPVNRVHVVLPAGVDDIARPSGGNVYDRRVCRGLTALGWDVQEHRAVGTWPAPDPLSLSRLRDTMAGIPDGELVVLDGLVASAGPDVLLPEARRLRTVVILHMPLGLGTAGAGSVTSGSAGEGERAVLAAVAAVVVTSGWTRDWLVESYRIDEARIRMAEPGTDPAALTVADESGGRFLCVGAVSRQKGYDTLLDALADVRDLGWRLRCVGALDVDPELVGGLAHHAGAAGIRKRLRVSGPGTASEVAAAYADADLLVLASRAETYGMVVTEALARGLPVVATSVGGVPQALGYGEDRSRPGLLVAADDAPALGRALRAWLVDADLRRVLRRAALARRATLPTWSATSSRLGETLVEVAS